MLPEYGWFDDGSNCSEHRAYSDARFVLFVGCVAWFVSVCRCDNYVCCDCHDARSYCAKHSNNAGRRLFCKWFCGNVSILGWRNSHLCSYIISDASSGG